MEALRLLTILLGISLAFSSSPEENIGDRDLFEGDLKLLPGQKFAIDHGLDLGPVDAFGASKARRWTNGVVPYTLASSLSGSSSARGVINSAMKEWSTKTCLKFVQRTSQSYYIEFFKGSGCWSYVGMTGRRQQISLAGGCWHHGIVVHEIGHALGFWHEQSRPDRDDYITVVWDNIRSANRHNFNKYTNTQINSLNIPYDYASIMHYGRRSFSINGKDTIVPKRSGVTIGQRRGLSSSDVKQMNLMYECQQGTPQPPTPPQPQTPPKPSTPPTPPRPGTTLPPRPTAPSRGIEVDLRSEGCEDPKLVNIACGRAYIRVNGRDYSLKRRGFNVVLVDYKTGRVEDQKSYDTHGSTAASNKMANQLNSWAGAKQRKIVLVAIQDEGANRLNDAAQLALVRLGGKSPISPRYRGSYALIGYTGPERPSWIEQVRNVKRRGPSLLKKTIYYNPGPGPVTTPRPRPSTTVAPGTRPPVGTSQPPTPPKPQTPPKPSTPPTPPRPGTTLPPRPTAPSRGIKVDLRSEGCEDPKLVNIACGRAYIRVNGRDYSLKRRGFNVVLVDYKTGRVEDQKSYDTHGSRTASSKMANQLNSWASAKQRKIVLVAIQDEGANRLNNAAQLALVRLGGKSPISPRYRGSYALIGYTGPERPSWIEQVRNVKRRGPSLLKKTIYYNPGPGPVTTPRPRPSTTVAPGTRPPVGNCGVSGSLTRVIGGTDAAPGAWPWQIAILSSSSGRFSCGGSLIYNDWIVTAAHCIRSRVGSSYTILLGAHNRNSPQSHEQRIKGKRVIVHPQYGRPSLSNDIALIQLERSARLSNRVSTVCLPTHDYALPLSSTCYITGWGKIKHPGTSHHILQQAKLAPVDQQECKRKLAASPSGGRLSITDQMLCAGVKDTILSGCHGDSGGPYVCRDASNRFVLQGVVSWGSPRCSASERYTVFARVAKFRNWIEQEIKKTLG